MDVGNKPAFEIGNTVATQEAIGVDSLHNDLEAGVHGILLYALCVAAISAISSLIAAAFIPLVFITLPVVTALSTFLLPVLIKKGGKATQKQATREATLSFIVIFALLSCLLLAFDAIIAFNFAYLLLLVPIFYVLTEKRLRQHFFIMSAEPIAGGNEIPATAEVLGRHRSIPGTVIGGLSSILIYGVITSTYLPAVYFDASIFDIIHMIFYLGTPFIIFGIQFAAYRFLKKTRPDFARSYLWGALIVGGVIIMPQLIFTLIMSAQYLPG